MHKRVKRVKTSLSMREHYYADQHKLSWRDTEGEVVVVVAVVVFIQQMGSSLDLEWKSGARKGGSLAPWLTVLLGPLPVHVRSALVSSGGRFRGMFLLFSEVEKKTASTCWTALATFLFIFSFLSWLD